MNMNIWTSEEWKNLYQGTYRTGLRLKSDKDVDSEVKRACKEFCKWLRTKYVFPIRVPVYLKSSCRIHTMDNDVAYGTFFEPENKFVEPYIRIATGDYMLLYNKYGKDSALATILHTIAHELTHYYQWINSSKLTDLGEERQANKTATIILDMYSETREHP